MQTGTAVILGCGYTGQRLARTLLARGMRVIATSRHPEDLDVPGAEGVRFDLTSPESRDRLASMVPPGALIVHSIPPVDGRDFTAELVGMLNHRAARVVYISTTGVYGAKEVVDATTAIAPVTARERLRARTEEILRHAPFPVFIIRSPAIYGPGRGVHVALRRGDFSSLAFPDSYVSRIHVDDLAAHVDAALLSDAQGAYPAGDEHPCTRREIAEFCAGLLGIELPGSVPASAATGETMRSDRRVDGRAVRHLLGVSLQYPSYREGIPAALNEEHGVYSST